MITLQDFQKIDIRVGTIIDAQLFAEAIKPAYKLRIDFGTLGIKNSSAQITHKYNVEDLIGKQIVAVVNFPSKKIANLMSECLVLGAVDADHRVTLLSPDMQIENGLAIA